MTGNNISDFYNVEQQQPKKSRHKRFHAIDSYHLWVEKQAKTL